MTPLRPDGTDRYRADDGRTMAREVGNDPNGNPIAGRWVLRGSEGEWIDCSSYRQDLVESHDLRFVRSEPGAPPEHSGQTSPSSTSQPANSPAPG